MAFIAGAGAVAMAFFKDGIPALFNRHREGRIRSDVRDDINFERLLNQFDELKLDLEKERARNAGFQKQVDALRANELQFNRDVHARDLRIQALEEECEKLRAEVIQLRKKINEQKNSKDYS